MAFTTKSTFASEPIVPPGPLPIYDDTVARAAERLGPQTVIIAGGTVLEDAHALALLRGLGDPLVGVLRR